MLFVGPFFLFKGNLKQKHLGSFHCGLNNFLRSDGVLAVCPVCLLDTSNDSHKWILKEFVSLSSHCESSPFF